MTHGKGKKGGRGAGLRGGKGNAGLLKHKYMHMKKYDPDHFGRHGFKRPQSILKNVKIINVGDIEEKFVGKKEINLTKLGYDKLLGGGQIKTKIKITVDSASEKAIEKIKEKGGEVIVPEEEVLEEKDSVEEIKEEIEPKTDEKTEDK
jgi:large subunit ribosomal protein L15